MTIRDRIAEQHTESGVVAALAVAAVEGQPVYDRDGGAPVVYIGGVPIDTERYARVPSMPAADVELHDIESLVQYGHEFYAVGHPRTYLHAIVNPGRHEGESSQTFVSMTTVFEDDQAEQASWRRHRAHVDFALSEDWIRWTSRDAVRHDQAEFAAFLEDNAAAITDPTAADILELVANFEQTTATTFSSSVRLEDGRRRLVYREDGVGEKDLILPASFRIGIPVFRGIEQAFGFTARLRYRAQGGLVSFWYELVRTDLVLEAAVEDLESRFEAAHDGVSEFVPPVLRGRAPEVRGSQRPAEVPF